MNVKKAISAAYSLYLPMIESGVAIVQKFLCVARNNEFL